MGDSVNNVDNASKNRKKKNDKYRKRDPKSMENIKKATENMTTQQQLEFISEKYNELYEESRDIGLTLQEREKQLVVTQKDRSREHAELTKLILAKGQLENLCRELQKQNKIIKEENVTRIKEEEDRRREVANAFTERLTTLTNLIVESKDKSNKFKEENQSMTDKLTELYKQYQQRESHLETVTKQLELQQKLAETQAKKVEIEHEAERQTILAQKKLLEAQVDHYQREVILFQEKNRSLEAQLDLYKSQYSDFEVTMAKSNKVFETFKKEMSKMSKELRLLESERDDFRKRWQSSVNSLIVLSEKHINLANEQSALEKKLTTLQKLCRQLQEERSTFLKQLKENNIEPLMPNVQNQDSNKPDDSEFEKPTPKALKMKRDLAKVEEVVKLASLSLKDEGITNTENNESVEGDLQADQNEASCTTSDGQPDTSSFQNITEGFNKLIDSTLNMKVESCITNVEAKGEITTMNSCEETKSSENFS